MHAVWARRDELERVERARQGLDPTSPPSLRDLMAEKKMMEREMREAEDVHKQYKKKHIALMGKTDNLGVVMGGLLDEARQLTAGRK